MAPTRSVGRIARSAAVLVLLHLASHAVAQDSDSPAYAAAFSKLPDDLRSYLSAMATNTAVAGEVIGDYITEPDDVFGPDSQRGQRGPTYSEALPFIQGAESYFQQAATATYVPEDQQAVLASVARVISADAANDGLAGSSGSGSVLGQTSATATADTSNAIGSITSGVVTTTGVSGSRATTSSSSPVSSSTKQASPSTSSNRAAGQATGMASVLYSFQLLLIPMLGMFA